MRPTLYLAAGSLIAICGLFALSNPLDSAALVILFFILAFVFLNSFFLLLAMAPTGQATDFGRRRAILLGTLITVFLMFSSTRSLNLTDIVILTLILFGLYFYLRKS